MMIIRRACPSCKHVHDYDFRECLVDDNGVWPPICREYHPINKERCDSNAFILWKNFRKFVVRDEEKVAA